MLQTQAGVDEQVDVVAGREEDDAPGIVVGLLVAFNDGAAEFVRQVAQGPLQQRGLAGAGRADQVKDKNPFLFEQGAVEACQAVVFAQDILFDGDSGPLDRFSVVFVIVGMCV